MSACQFLSLRLARGCPSSKKFVCYFPLYLGPHTAFPHTNFLIKGLSFFSQTSWRNDFALASFVVSAFSRRAALWSNALVPLRLHSGLYLSVFASNLSALRACLGFAGFPVMRQPARARLCHSLACSCQRLLSSLCSHFCTATFDFCFSCSSRF